MTIRDVLTSLADPAHRRIRSVWVPMRGDLVERRAELDEALKSPLDADERRQAQAELATVTDELAASLVEFKFAAIGGRAWLDLCAKHPPTKAQLDAAPPFQRPDVNRDTFRPAAVAACCVEPDMTEAEARELEALLPLGSFELLYSEVSDLNRRPGDVPKARTSGRGRQPSAPSVSTAASEGSPVPSSSDE